MQTSPLFSSVNRRRLIDSSIFCSRWRISVALKALKTARKWSRGKAFKQTHFLVHEKFMRNDKVFSFLSYASFTVFLAHLSTALAWSIINVIERTEEEISSRMPFLLSKDQPKAREHNRKCASISMWKKPIGRVIKRLRDMERQAQFSRAFVLLFFPSTFRFGFSRGFSRIGKLKEVINSHPSMLFIFKALDELCSVAEELITHRFSSSSANLIFYRSSFVNRNLCQI